MNSKNIAKLLVWAALSLFAKTANSQDISGLWDAKITCPGGEIRFGIDLKQVSGEWSGFIVNGPERIKLPSVEFDGKTLVIKIDHYDSRIAMEWKTSDSDQSDQFLGKWKKRRGKTQWVTMECSAARHGASDPESPDGFIGRWSVTFAKSKDPAVAVFQQIADSNRVLGNFMTTTGDYRYLDGEIRDGKLELSCFDGAHAFLFRAELDQAGSIKGHFWSSNTWSEDWSAKLDSNAALPDDFKQTSFVENSNLGALSFPDLDGIPTRLDDPKFAGNARMIYVFGSWCPNCHDAGKYFAELEQQYGDQGLSILGLAFEVTGDFERDSEQVRKYVQRHGIGYPILVAGLADKSVASEALPILDRVRSYPTTIFIDRNGKVRAVHTGFTGPATGDEFKKLKTKFEGLIEAMLSDD